MTAPSSSAARRHRPAFLAVDFFCGAGGTTRGLIDAGGYVIAGVDKDSRCRQTYVDNNLNTTIDFAAPRFIRRDVFPKTTAYEQGEQHDLFDDLTKLIEKYRTESPETPLMSQFARLVSLLQNFLVRN